MQNNNSKVNTTANLLNKKKPQTHQNQVNKAVQHQSRHE